MGAKIIVILGITGTQGSSVATTFFKHNNWRIRGITRNPDSEKAKAWTHKGVEIVQADQNDVELMRRAFKGANAIFAVTDYASNYANVSGDEALQQKAEAAGRSIDEYAADLEQAQGINIATAAADAGVLTTLEKFVFSTLAGVKNISSGKYTHAYEFDSKANVEEYIRENLPSLGEKMSTVIMGIYQETWTDIPAFAPQKDDEGGFFFVRLKWPGPHQDHPQVIASRDTGAFVEALVLHHPPGTHVLGASEIIDKSDYAALWGRVLGVRASVKDVSEEVFASYVPVEIRATMLDLFKFFVEYGYAGGNPMIKTPAELGIQTTTLEEFVRDEDWSSVFKGQE
ncbi:MAG: hypothetical protein Q9209_004903 [Squamulea sp. 1 TL-2023]